VHSQQSAVLFSRFANVAVTAGSLLLLLLPMEFPGMAALMPLAH